MYLFIIFTIFILVSYKLVRFVEKNVYDKFQLSESTPITFCLIGRPISWHLNVMYAVGFTISYIFFPQSCGLMYWQSDCHTTNLLSNDIKIAKLAHASAIAGEFCQGFRIEVSCTHWTGVISKWARHPFVFHMIRSQHYVWLQSNLIQLLDMAYCSIVVVIQIVLIYSLFIYHCRVWI